jgi:CheY-like chemotaxis protein
MEDQGKKKILLIDDDASLLVTLSDFLKFEGYQVVTADSGEQGLKRLEKMTPDLIILDMSMPGMGGVGFLREISSPEGKPTHPVLVLTARSNMAEFFANVDVDGFVAKPCDPEDLLMEVGRIIFLRSGDGTADAGAPRLGKKKVLLGEDDKLVNENLKMAFSDAGYTVESVSKGPEILEQAIVQKPDLIVMKLVFASMNGDAVAGMLKEMPNTKDIPVILYDDTGSKAPDAKFIKSHPSVKKFVSSNNSVTLLAGIREVLKV